MVQITLPDGSQRQYPGPVTVADVAQSIGAGLARAALAGRVSGTGGTSRLVDTSHLIEQDANLSIITAKDRDGVDVLRHSTAHLLAYAVKDLFPDAQVTIGPVIDNGFYYDFAYERPFTPEDLELIEKRMHELAKKDEVVQREVWTRNDAVAFFKGIGEDYKAEIIESIPEDQVLSMYREGDFIDLCRGPHVPSTGKLKVFKLMKVAGAYWRGDSNNEMLQRIYGTAWATKEDQDAYLHMLEEAEKRDHRKLGRELDLFHFQEEAPGAVFWHPNGWTLFQQLISYMRQRHNEADYVEVNTPDVMDRCLWEISGHWGNYRDHMFTTQTEDERIFALKPMNCPGAASLFGHGLRSYRDLPLRMAEFGKVHRYEPSGALHGLMRVRHFTQDDAHVFCTPGQMEEECRHVIDLTLGIYRQFGFNDVTIKLSTRPANRIGSDELWDRLEGALSSALDGMGLSYQLNPGEGAFYGPKLEFVLRDAIGRDWQCGTLQVDLNLPERFGLEYVAENGQRERPVMLHRAFFGSLERFTGILLEHYSGALPTWLSPVQAVVCCISEPSAEYAEQVFKQLKEKGFRVKADVRSEKITYKVREHSLQKVPYILVVGDKERQSGQVAVRVRGGGDLGVMPLEAFEAHLAEDVASGGNRA
ncbi:MAG: threonine--tRNA ligase [Corticimicrobacter sp.]|uniref:threonine--tRNA ligase n=1 Tax=Corticimicrobacter sp. TaxID=2678536 RepID=UPI0032D9E888